MGLTERSGKKRTGKDETDLCRYREAEGIGVPGVAARAILNRFARDFEPVARRKKQVERVFEGEEKKV